MQLLLLLTLLTLSFSPLLEGCTDFLLIGKDSSAVVGRSMEFAVELSSDVIAHSSGEKIISKNPQGSDGVTWVSKYGFVAINAWNIDTAIDGMNEKGLSMEMLWLPGTIYPSVPVGEESKALDYLDLGSWILGNFSTVEEVKAAIKDVIVWAHPAPVMNAIPPLHLSIHDANGKSGVIEFIDGKTLWHDNPSGVLTNNPPFDWQIQNLANYINLQPVDIESKTVAGITLTQTGHGSGSLGIPGDYTPPGRFVRAFFLKAFATPQESSDGGVNLALHILNAVDIPKGVTRDTAEKNSRGDFTQWIVIKDLTKKRLFFRSYDHLDLKMVDLAKIDFKKQLKGAKVPLNLPQKIEDVTAPFLQ